MTMTMAMATTRQMTTTTATAMNTMTLTPATMAMIAATTTMTMTTTMAPNRFHTKTFILCMLYCASFPSGAIAAVGTFVLVFAWGRYVLLL